MNLVRLIYASRFTPGVGPAEVEEIVKTSREHNAASGVTGVLCYAPGLFLQCLEGSRPEVNRLYHRIANDTRHKDLTLLAFDEIGERAFSDWTMAYVRADELTAPLLLRFGASRQFDPFAMSAGEALGFVSALAGNRQLLRQEEG